MKRAFRIHIAILLIVLFGYLLTSCKTVYVPIESKTTEYRDKYLRDSIYMLDSMFIDRWKNGDTVFITKEKFRYIYKDKIQRDTVNITDSIQAPYPVEAQLSNWEKIKMDVGGWAIGLLSGLLIILGVWLFKRF